MRPIQHDSYVAGIDDEDRSEIIRNALHDRQAQLVSWREEPMGGGASGSELCSIVRWGRPLPAQGRYRMITHTACGC